MLGSEFNPNLGEVKKKNDSLYECHGEINNSNMINNVMNNVWNKISNFEK